MNRAFAPAASVIVARASSCARRTSSRQAPYESTMGLVQKIFYFHVPSWMAMYTAIAVCGLASAIYLFKGNKTADAYAWPRPRLPCCSG